MTATATAPLLNATLFKVGDQLAFVYNDKQREGTIERVTHSGITLRNMKDEEEKYKSFRYSKMQNVTWLLR